MLGEGEPGTQTENFALCATLERRPAVPVPRLKAYEGPAILSYGFRPFFFLGGLYAGLAILIWLPLVFGRLRLLTAFDPVDWHIHEMLFGFLPAIVTGFLLTAVPNWTGRLPVQGRPLGLLVALWLIGRLAVLFSALIGPVAAGLLDCLFLVAVAGVTATEIIAGRNWRNLKVLIPLTVLLLANLIFHGEVYFSGTSDYARRLAVAAAVMLIILIGGRIIPSFTRNWLAREMPGRLPAAFGRFDAATIFVSIAALAGWVAAPQTLATGVLMSTAGVLHLVRMGRWAGDRTWREPLVVVLHLSYLFVPAGFILSGLAAIVPHAVLPAAGLHAFGAGAIGTMTLTVMMRASLGHTGHALTMSRISQAIYVSAAVAALIRIAAAFDSAHFEWLVLLSGVFWALAFIGFAVSFAPKLMRRKAVADPRH
jgi:uncharacterized protein involved in response to NO